MPWFVCGYVLHLAINIQNGMVHMCGINAIGDGVYADVGNNLKNESKDSNYINYFILSDFFFSSDLLKIYNERHFG